MESKETESQNELEKLLDQAMDSIQLAKIGDDILLLARMDLKEEEEE